jgi:hypothetical protein
MTVVETMRMVEAQASDSSLNKNNNDGDSSLESIRIIMIEAQASDSSLNKNNKDGDSSLITNTKNNGG